MKKNKVKIMIAFIIGLFMTIGSFSEVKAIYFVQDYKSFYPNGIPKIGQEWAISINGTDRSIYAKYTIDGQKTYCIQSLVEAKSEDPNYVAYDLAEYLRNLGLSYDASEALANEIGIIGGLGYGYANDYSDGMAWATQIKIWQKLNDYGVPNNGVVGDINSATWPYINTLNDRINNYNKNVSFNGTSITLTGYGKENGVTLTDTSGVYSQYGNTSISGIHSERNGNSLTIWAEKGDSVDTTLTYTLSTGTYRGRSIAYSSPTSQNQVLSGGAPDKVVSVTVHLRTGSVQLDKRDSTTGTRAQGDATLVGAVYSLISDATGKEVGKLTIGEDLKSNIIENLSINTTYTIKEVTAPEGYMLNTDTIKVTWANPNGVNVWTSEAYETPILNYFEITKMLGATSNSEKTALEGAKFTFILTKYVEQYGSFEEALKHTDEYLDTEWAEFTTDATGYGKTRLLAYGNYTVSETVVPSEALKCSDFTIDITQDTSERSAYTLKDATFVDSTNTLDDIEKAWLDSDGNLVDEPKVMQIKIRKVNNFGVDAGKDVDFTKGDAVLKGAKYEVYKYNETTQGYTDYVYDITVDHQDEDGYWCAETGDLLVGKYGRYMIKEKVKSTETVDGVTYNYSYADGYLADPNEYEFEQDSTMQEEKRVFFTKVSKEVPITGRGRIIKYNNDNNNDETKNDTDKDSSVGAKLRLRLVSAIGTDKEAENTYYATIDENGYAEFIDEEYAAIYPDDKNTIPFGTYQIDEVEASTNGTHTYFYMQPEEVTITKQHEVESRIVSDEPISAYLKIIKKDADSKEEVHIAGAKYMVWDCQAGEFITQMLTPSGEYTNVFETNDEGYCYLPQKLYAGDYIVYEIEAPEGYYLDEAYRLPENEEDYGNIEKGGAKVTIDTIATGIVDGTVYDKNLELSVDVEIYNTVLKAQIDVEKTGEVLTGATVTTNYDTGDYVTEEKEEKYTPTYTLKGLEGVEYQIIAVNDIKSPDGRYTYVHANDVVDTLKTDENGYDKTVPLYLGEYKIVETVTPKGYLKDENIENITLENNDELEAIKIYNKQLNDVRQKLQLTFEKTFDDINFANSESPEQKALFGVYTKNAITDYTGKNVVIPANKLVDLIWTDENNDVTSQIDLPEGTYTVKELYVTYPYTKNVDEQTFELKYNGNSSQEFVVKQGESVANTYDSASITLVKLSTAVIDNIVLNGNQIDTTEFDEKTAEIINTIKGKTTEEIKEYFKENEISCVPNAEYTVYTDEACTKALMLKNETTGKFEIAEIVTDESGVIELENIPLGEYWIKETKAPKGYALSDEKTHITLDQTTKNTMVYQALIEEDIVEAFLTKIDIFTGEVIPDCTFEIKDKETDEVLLHSITDENGKAYIPISLFEDGKTYTYTEIDAPDIYELNTEPHEFTAKFDEEGNWAVKQETVENTRKKSTVTLTKLDFADSTVIPNCKFELRSLETDYVVTGVTDEKGIYVFENVPYGKYTYTELEAPEEYLIDTTPHEIEINAEEMEIKITNEKAPDTGDIAVYVLSTVALISAVGIIYIIKKNAISEK